MTIELETSLSEFDAEASKAFAGRFVGILNDAATALLTSVGHQTGLFETLAGLPAATSEQIADASDLNERYVREWLGGMTAARGPADQTTVSPRHPAGSVPDREVRPGPRRGGASPPWVSVGSSSVHRASMISPRPRRPTDDAAPSGPAQGGRR